MSRKVSRNRQRQVRLVLASVITVVLALMYLAICITLYQKAGMP